MFYVKHSILFIYNKHAKHTINRFWVHVICTLIRIFLLSMYAMRNLLVIFVEKGTNIVQEANG